MKFCFIIFLGLVFMSSCATREKYQEKVNTWVGQPREKLLSLWGEPENIGKTKSGTEFFRYDDHRVRTSLSASDETPSIQPSYYRSADARNELPDPKAPPAATHAKSSGGGGGHNESYTCLTLFYFSSGGKIESVGFSGPDCLAK